ncbi:galactose mutarotase [Chitinophaga filiformis]|uniref:aldose epimerase family protein n=1 Tax=Chitinophaga filiformis TaxID=104663 RepID=UPI001F15B8B2|nr:aldose epimerase family protein [Chitinophaga filiformis]MCF6407460.1 galactose mutarotase [Chitinophaga filiformis]MCF6407634.1 galactose mutarotase [Chitinophaga filiformis]
MLNVNSRALSATRIQYGELRGAPLYMITLENAAVTVQLINLGATITALYAPDKAGIQKNVVAGFSNPLDYLHNPAYFGCTVGRYANRIAGGRFIVEGREYQLPVNNDGNHLHGGFEGFHTRIWQVIQSGQSDEEASVIMEYVSADGEEGYPGTLTARVQYVLDDRNQLHIRYTAHTDKSTPVSMTNHSYFNLSGFEQPLITEHLLTINAKTYTEKSDRNIPTGNIVPVSGTPLDFTRATRIGGHIHEIPADRGFDHNFVLQSADAPAAILEDPYSGRTLRIFTDQPGIQVYTANYWDGNIKGQQGKPYLKHGAVALETQAFPDSPNHAHFPDTILSPGDIYRRHTIFAFDVQ